MSLKETWSLIIEVINKWIDDKVFKLSAALSFYSIISLAPLLVISISMAGSVWGEQAAQSEIINQIEKLVGSDSVGIIQSVLRNVNEKPPGVIETIISILLLLFASTAMFAELHDSLNVVWKIKSKPGYILWSLVKERLVAFVMVISMGILLFVSLAAGALMNSINLFLRNFIVSPFDFAENVNIFIQVCATYLLFLFIFKFLSDAIIRWKIVLIGAFISTMLFMLGRYLIGLYLTNTNYASVFGTAGSLALLLLWVYYSAQILFFGAEFICVLAERYGGGIKATKGAEVIKNHV
jgi:membrane protein